MNYEGKFGTVDPQEEGNALDNLFLKSEAPDLVDTDEALETPILVIDMDELDKRTLARATDITEKLAAYYFDQKYIDNHPYITSKITQEQWVYGSRYVYFDGNRLSAFNCEQTVIICDG
jgi:hypothetical protein